ncbi:MAG: hypothetical protein H7844_10250 [Nitrospirae bacterium YQR-1]
MITVEDNKSNLIKIVFVFLIVFYSFVFIKTANYHVSLIYYPHQVDVAELEMVLSTDLLLKGKNPYDFVNHPMYLNCYGIVYNYMTLPVHKILSFMYPGLSGIFILSHRMTAGIFIVLSVMLTAAIMYSLKYKLIFIYGAAVIQYVSLLFLCTPLTRPDSLGTFLYLLSIAVPWRLNYSKNSVIASIILGLLAFYTKGYFVIGVLIVISYIFLFLSKKTGIKYLVTFITCFVVSAVIVNEFYEAYFYDTLIMQYNTNVFQVDMMIKQSVYFILCNIGLFLYLSISLYFALSANYQAVVKQIRSFFENINLLNADKPLFYSKTSIFSYAAFVSLCLLELKLGCTTGAWMTYYMQLFLPFFLIYTLNIKLSFIRTPVILMLMSAVSAYSVYSLSMYSKIITPYSFIMDDPSKRFRREVVEQFWSTINGYVKTSKNILVSKEFNFVVFNMGKGVYDSGVNNYFNKVTPKNKVLKYFFPKDFRALHESFENDIDTKIKNKFFDVLILTFADDRGSNHLYITPWYIRNATVFDNYAIAGQYRFNVPDLPVNYNFLVLKPQL